MNATDVDWPGLPTTLNFRNSSVPEPVSDPAWNADMTRWPAFAAFAVISMPELNVPA
jgi:hypothetical protein